MTTKTRDERLTEVGESAIASIREFAAALACDYERMEELRTERDSYSGDRDENTEQTWTEAYPEDAEELAQLEAAANCNGSPCDNQDDARDRVLEDALSLEFRSGWETSWDRNELQPAEFCLLLATGGPAVRILGEINRGEASRAWLEVQDWGTSWTEVICTGSEHDALMAYVGCFCFEV